MGVWLLTTFDIVGELGWGGLLPGSMSGISDGSDGAIVRRVNFDHGNDLPSALIVKSLARLVTSSTEPRPRMGISPAGFAHSVSVCCEELSMRGKVKKRVQTPSKGGGLPRFVDVSLTPEQRTDFKAQTYTADSLAKFLAGICDDGYRVGVTWSGEQQAYTVSLTCRDPDSENDGLCMTSFAGDLLVALALAAYKHVVVTEGVWPSGGSKGEEDWG